MTNNEYERLAAEILAAVQQQKQHYSAVEMVDYLAGQGHRREVVQATMLDLIDRGKVKLTSDLRLSARPM